MMTEPEDKLADDAEAAERARRLAKIPPKAPLTCRMVHVHNGMSRKNRRAAAKNRQRLQFEGKKANEPIVAEPIKTGTMLEDCYSLAAERIRRQGASCARHRSAAKSWHGVLLWYPLQAHV